MNYYLFIDYSTMDTQEYLEKMKIINSTLLTYIENEENSDENFQNLITILQNSNLRINPHEIKSLLYLLSNISDNHHRTPSFFTKIGQVFQIYKEEIKNYFSNFEIFNIFKKNKRTLLLLIEKQILLIDKTITKIMTTPKYKEAKYPLYFLPEIKPFINDSLIEELTKEIPENYDEKRKNGENDDHLCELIRNGSIDDFTSFLTQTQIELSSEIKPSIFETNPFLLNKKLTLIEYAAFFGSTSIVKYLNTNCIDISPSLWLYAIHGQNLELIHFLEEKQIYQIDDSYAKALKESIKCHHNEITNYILSTLPATETQTSLKAFSESFKYYNFAYTSDAFVNESSFFNLCYYGYYPLVNILLKIENINVNTKVIFLIIFLF